MFSLPCGQRAPCCPRNPQPVIDSFVPVLFPLQGTAALGPRSSKLGGSRSFGGVSGADSALDPGDKGSSREFTAAGVKARSSAAPVRPSRPARKLKRLSEGGCSGTRHAPRRCSVQDARRPAPQTSRTLAAAPFPYAHAVYTQPFSLIAMTVALPHRLPASLAAATASDMACALVRNGPRCPLEWETCQRTPVPDTR